MNIYVISKDFYRFTCSTLVQFSFRLTKMAAESSPIYVISTQISRVNIPLAGKAGLISKMADEDPGKFEVQSG